ncbi:hypothetical protein [Streptomyces sp. APSN-46.1]|uniref:hypothetical protein n=1 Tax=Streptomyces sp. APSN-46.1 TaxID=2929049 RepID=UPI0035AB8386
MSKKPASKVPATASAAEPAVESVGTVGATARPTADGAVPAALPGRLTGAAALTALEGLALAGLGVYMLFVGIAGDPDSPQQAETGGVTLLALAALPLIAARGLRLGRRWSRGPALITQLMALPVAWTLWTTGGAMTVAAVALALAAVAVVALLVNPTATEALGIGPGDQTR